MVSATQHQSHLWENLQNEIQLGRILGPLKHPLFSKFHCSQVCDFPKKQGRGVWVWRMITNLSAPAGRSVNDFIDPKACSVNYKSSDKALQMTQHLGPNALLRKMDISNAYRLLI